MTEPLPKCPCGAYASDYSRHPYVAEYAASLKAQVPELCPRCAQDRMLAVLRKYAPPASPAERAQYMAMALVLGPNADIPMGFIALDTASKKD